MWPEVQHALSTVATAIGTVVVAGGGFAAVGFAIFKFFGEKWLNSKFEENLTAFKHEQQKEIERLKFKINALMDRTVKLHQKEFDVVPEIWARLVEAYNKTLQFTSPMQIYPDLNRYSDRELEDFIEHSNLTKLQKEELLQARDRHGYYVRVIFYHNLFKTKNVCYEYSLYFEKNGIFLQREMREKFREMDDLLWGAISDHELNREYGDLEKNREKIKCLSVRGKELKEQLEIDVRDRLWSVNQIDFE